MNIPTSLLSFNIVIVSGNKNVVSEPLPILIPQGCGNSDRQFGIEGEGVSLANLSSQSTLNHLVYAINKIKDGIETSEVKMHFYECFPRDYRLPQNLPFIYERDSIENREPWQEARIAILEIAYRAKNLFSVSFLPEDPLVKQTLYMRKGYVAGSFIMKGYRDGGVEEGTQMTSFNSKSSSSNASEKDAENCKFLTGMLKPYPTFSSSLCRCDERLEDISNIWAVSSNYDLPLPIENLEAGNLKKSLTKMTQLFVKDRASRMAIIYLQPLDLANPVKKLIIIK